MKCLKEGRGTQGGGETGTKLRASLKHAQWHSLKGKQQRSRLKDVEEGENTEERRGWRRGERLGRDTSSRQSALRLRVNILPTTVSDNIFRRKSAWVLEFTFIADERQAQARLSLGAGSDLLGYVGYIIGAGSKRYPAALLPQVPDHVKSYHIVYAHGNRDQVRNQGTRT